MRFPKNEGSQFPKIHFPWNKEEKLIPNFFFREYNLYFKKNPFKVVYHRVSCFWHLHKYIYIYIYIFIYYIYIYIIQIKKKCFSKRHFLTMHPIPGHSEINPPPYSFTDCLKYKIVNQATCSMLSANILQQ